MSLWRASLPSKILGGESKAFKETAYYLWCESIHSGLTAAPCFEKTPFGANSKLKHINKKGGVCYSKGDFPVTPANVLNMFKHLRISDIACMYDLGTRGLKKTEDTVVRPCC